MPACQNQPNQAADRPERKRQETDKSRKQDDGARQ
jgi:hypothetical protein